MSPQAASQASDDSDEEWVTESDSDGQMSDVSGESDLQIQKMQQLLKQTPEGHPDYLKYQQLLGILFRQRFVDSGDLNDLETSLQIHQAALDLCPEGHPDRAECLQTLAMAFTARYERLEDMKDLDAALQNEQEAVDLTPEDDPYRADRLQNLAISFTERYQKSEELKDLETALQRFQEAVALIPAEPDKVECLKGLALSFRSRYLQLGDLKDLEAALQNFQKAVDLTPEGHSDRAVHLQNLAVSFTDRYNRLGEVKDLEAALQKDQEAVDLTPEEHPDRAWRLQSLAMSLRNRYQRFGDLKDLEATMQKFQDAVNLTPEDDPDRVEHLQNLAVSFGDRYKRLGNLEDLETTVQKFQEAVDLTPEGHPNRAVCLRNLAVSFADRYHRLGDLNDLKTALEKDQEALNITPEGKPDRPGQLENLAISFRDRYQRLTDLEDLEAALQEFQEAVDLTPDGHPDKARYFQNLAQAFRDRYQRLGDVQDLEAAFQRFQEAVASTPRGHPARAGYLQSLGISFTDQYRRLGELKDLEAALENDQEAVDSTPEGHPDRAGRLQSLATSFQYRYQRLGELKDLEAAFSKFQEAVNVTPQNHPDRAERLLNLAVSFGYRYKKWGDLEDLEAALQNCQEAVDLIPEEHPYRAEHIRHLAMFFCHRYERFREPEDLETIHSHFTASFNNPTLTPQDSWKAALEWGDFAAEYQPSDCIAAYLSAFNLLPELLWIGHPIHVRHDAIHRLDIGQATSTATQACINLSELAVAVEIMEQGLATIFQQTLQLKADVTKLPPNQAEALQKLSSELYSGTFVNPKDLAIQRQHLLKEIRQQKGLENFLLPQPYKVLRQASKNGPVVILNSHEDYCDGIIILNPTADPVHVPLPNVTFDVLKSQQIILKELLGRCNVRARGESASTRLFGQREPITSKPPQESFEDLLSWLWTNIVAPVYEVLESNGIHNGRLWWLPTGAFTGLPLHACPPTKNFIPSYTATLGSLLDAHSKKSTTTSKFGVVGVTHTGGGWNYLQGVEEEVKKILSIIKKPQLECLEGEQATVDAVKLQLQDCSWVHLACHGTQDLIEPTKSHLLLYGGNLELETILQMPLSNAEFVFLAACQTVMGDAELVNESFHIGGGFIAAGFKGAIGTMWSMNDKDGPLVAEIFYSYLFRDGRQPYAYDTAEALQVAVEELKKRKVPYERWVPFIHMGV